MNHFDFCYSIVSDEPRPGGYFGEDMKVDIGDFSLDVLDNLAVDKD